MIAKFESLMFQQCIGKLLAAGLAAAFLGCAGGAVADPIRHPVATFAGLDKTTGRIINFDTSINETVQFGALQITPRVCNTRPQTEAPQTTSFVEVDEIIVKPGARGKADPKAQEAKRIFSGWMFAASPGLHGVEHSVYDVWLVDCKGGKEVVQQPVQPDAAAPPDEQDKKSKKKKRRRGEPKPADAAPATPAADASPDAQSVTPVPAPEAPAVEEAPKPRKKKRKPRPAAAPPAGDPGLGGLPF